LFIIFTRYEVFVSYLHVTSDPLISGGNYWSSNISVYDFFKCF